MLRVIVDLGEVMYIGLLLLIVKFLFCVFCMVLIVYYVFRLIVMLFIVLLMFLLRLYFNLINLKKLWKNDKLKELEMIIE